MQNSVVIRLSGEQLLWFPPGASGGAQSLDGDEAKASLRSWCKEHRRAPIVAVPGADVTCHDVPFEQAEKKHILRSLPFMLEEHVGEDVENLHVVAGRIESSPLHTLVCRKSRLREVLEKLHGLPQARRCLPDYLLLPWQEGRWTLLREDTQLLVRTGKDQGFAVDQDLADVFLEAAVEQYGEPETAVIYSEQPFALPEFLTKKAQWCKGDFAAALMLADDSSSGINLLQGEFAPRLPLEKWWRKWRVAAAVLGIAFVAQLVATGLEYRALKAENLQLRAAVEQQFRTVFPKGRMQDPQKQLQRKLQSLGGGSGEASYTRLLYAVGLAVSERDNTRLLSVNYNARGGDMRVSLLAPDYSAVEALRAGMSEAGVKAVLESSNAQSDGVRARLRVRRP
ncbi:MAG: type II secretion system protein GspL [Gammaproteobacteria bacterium]|nr:MAG: type II secretion system protein GspL [Gammaproteobacteria bacterium]PIE37655.1 MAG: type II secretion system protein GspL [Gammaproteobacteria bacterium]